MKEDYIEHFNKVEKWSLEYEDRLVIGLKEDDDAHEWVDYFNGLVRENEMNEGVQNKDIDIGFLLIDD